MRNTISVILTAFLVGACSAPIPGAEPTGARALITDFGAIGDGVTDDTAAIQAAIDALERKKGGTLLVPPGTYLLNSYTRSPHPWYFYNLRVGSNITVQATPGAKFLQGPNGRALMPAGATEVRNSVLVFGSSNYVINTFQDPNYNGGFYYLQPTNSNDQFVALATASDASRFKVGDYVAIYATAAGDVVPSESSQVISVSKTGVLGLTNQLARGFRSPVIANVTSLATVNVGLNNLILQGTEPLAANELFGFTATGNTFISETAVNGGNTYGLNMNDTRDFLFRQNVVTSTGPPYVQELSQRNSQNVVLDSNSFDVVATGTGEYGAHWIITGNTFWLHPERLTSGAALSIGALDVVFSNNLVTGTNSGSTSLMTDYLGLDSNVHYMGQIRILNNTINCNLNGSNCLRIVTADPIVSNNQFNLTGSGQVVLVEGPLPQAAQITNNKMSVRNGVGIVLNTTGPDNSVVSCNTIMGSGPIGIYVTSPATPSKGKHVMYGNVVSGFRSNIDLDPRKHPNTTARDSLSPSTLGEPCHNATYLQ
jgi:hypothetical protein